MHTRFRDPAFLFCLLSLIFGLVVIAINPPLRGPDEGAHFLRIYSIAQGEIIPKRADDQGRRGLLLPAQIQADFSFFEQAREHSALSKLGIRDVLQTFVAGRQIQAQSSLVFRPFGGSEAYSPAPYLPYVAAGVILQILKTDFVTSQYAMRAAGLAAYTAMAAYAIAMTPHLKWAFFAIAMLPSALYSRTVLSADGAALAATLVILALCLRAASSGAGAGPGAAKRSLWMTLCVLMKPAQIAFLLLEGMTATLANHLRRWPTAILIILPGLCLTALWLVAGSADVGAWRIVEGTDLSPNEFNPRWKLRYMIENPWHFPVAAFRSLDYSIELWRQLIGVLGWLDTYLIPPAYPILTALMLATFFEALDVECKRRYRIAFWSAASLLAYTLAIFLIFFLIWTPTSSDRVLGIQGRYFLVILPPLAVCIATAFNRSIARRIVMSCAIGGALASGVATIAAILRLSE